MSGNRCESVTYPTDFFSFFALFSFLVHIFRFRVVVVMSASFDPVKEHFLFSRNGMSAKKKLNEEDEENGRGGSKNAKTE